MKKAHDLSINLEIKIHSGENILKAIDEIVADLKEKLQDEIQSDSETNDNGTEWTWNYKFNSK